jgi:hypothetical protein
MEASRKFVFNFPSQKRLLREHWFNFSYPFKRNIISWHSPFQCWHCTILASFWTSYIPPLNLVVTGGPNWFPHPWRPYCPAVPLVGFIKTINSARTQQNIDRAATYCSLVLYKANVLWIQSFTNNLFSYIQRKSIQYWSQWKNNLPYKLVAYHHSVTSIVC